MTHSEPVRAPGLTYRRNANGSRRYYWEASPSAVRASYQPDKPVRIVGDDQTETGRRAIEAEALRLHGDMLRFISRRGAGVDFDGTISGLIRRYQRDPESPYQAIKWNTRISYDGDLRRLAAGGGRAELARITRADIDRWYKAARAPKSPSLEPRIRGAHGLMTMLRIIVSYGASSEIAGCARLDMILNRMTFESPKARTERPTLEQAAAIIAKAHELGVASIALGQALQFDGILRQSNVTGMWRPLAPGEEPGGRQTMNGKIWEDGLRWDHLDKGFVLRFVTSKRDFAVEIDLSLYPLALAELSRVPPEQRIGPMVIDERSGLPYSDKGYAKRWRVIADAAGVPKTVWNRDSRSGGITEGRNAGADFEDLAKQAAHSDPNFTARVYARDNLEAARRVARLRSAKRRNVE